jgi:hypothetical protein
MSLNVDIPRQQPQEIICRIEGAGTVKEYLSAMICEISEWGRRS